MFIGSQGARETMQLHYLWDSVIDHLESILESEMQSRKITPSSTDGVVQPMIEDTLDEHRTNYLYDSSIVFHRIRIWDTNGHYEDDALEDDVVVDDQKVFEQLATAYLKKQLVDAIRCFGIAEEENEPF